MAKRIVKMAKMKRVLKSSEKCLKIVGTHGSGI